MSPEDYEGWQQADVAPTITHWPRDRSDGGTDVAVAFQQNTRDEVRLIGGDGQIAGCLPAEPGMKQQNYLAIGATVASALTASPSSPRCPNEDTTLIHTPMQVRRLTPVECARLQGFPDDYLDVIFRKKPATDGHKYKALGNSWAVPCAAWILRNMDKALSC
jgi:DNA (cytosine-5)-methyltransferase 1